MVLVIGAGTFTKMYRLTQEWAHDQWWPIILYFLEFASWMEAPRDKKKKWFRNDLSKGSPREVAENVLVLRFQAVVLQPELTSELPGGPVITQITGPHP